MHRNFRCTCHFEDDECYIHRKSAYRNPWKREDDDAFITLGDDDEEA